jgi:hypothetical protein
MKFGDDLVKKHDLSSLKVYFVALAVAVRDRRAIVVYTRVIIQCDTGAHQIHRYMYTMPFQILGSVGEPINSEAWLWFYNLVGHGKCSIADTFWQTETGGHVITPLPGATPMKPGSAVSARFPLLLLSGNLRHARR